MRKLLLLCGLALFLLAGVAYTANVSDARVGPQDDSALKRYEDLVKKCAKDAYDLNLEMQQVRNTPMEFRGARWTELYVLLQTYYKDKCYDYHIALKNLQWERAHPPPTPIPTPTPVTTSTSPSAPQRKPTPSSSPTGEMPVWPRDDTNKHIKFIEEQEKKLKKLRDSLIKEMEDYLKKARTDQPKPPKPGYKTEFDATDGLFIVNFTTPQGVVHVNLPADMRAGDTISGTVFVEPKGTTEEERARNRKALNGYQLMIANQKVEGPGTITYGGTTFTITSLLKETRVTFDSPGNRLLAPMAVVLPAGRPGFGFDFSPLADSIRVIEPTRPQTPTPNDFKLPTSGQNDSSIKGPFDGDLRTTEIKVGGQPVTKLAESLRSCVFKSPDQNFGPNKISVKENNVETKGTYRKFGVRLTAPKTSLLKGETTNVTIEVSGLAGIKEDVPLHLEAQGVINMDGGNYQYLDIRPQDVTKDGRYTTTRRITGQQAGGFSVIATVIHSESKSTERTSNVSRAAQPFSFLRTIGTVSATSGGKSVTAPPFGDVKAGDTIKTGANGIALLESVTSEQTTRIVLDTNTEVSYDPEKKDDTEEKKDEEEEEDDDDIEVPKFDLKEGSALNSVLRKASKRGIFLKIKTNMGVSGSNGATGSATLPPDPDDEGQALVLWGGSDRGKPRISPLAPRRLVRTGAMSFAGSSADYRPDQQTTTFSYAESFAMKSADSFGVVVIVSFIEMKDTEKKKITVNANQMGFITLWEKAAFRETGTGDTEKLAEEQARAALYATVNSLAVDDKTTVGTLTGQNNALADKLKKALQTAAIVKMLPKVGNKFAVAVEMSGAEMKKLIESLTGKPMGKHAVGVTSTLPDGVMARIEELRRQFKERTK